MCGHPAIVHIEQEVNGIRQLINLCEVCARNYGVLPSHVLPFSISQNIGVALFGGIDSSMIAHHCCKNCGCTLELLKKTGYLGCAQCYKHLQEKLLPLIKDMQKSLKHVGKRPRGFTSESPSISQREVLEERLRQAIETENFEEAVKIRDQLRLLFQDEND
jgi:protein arginine kinase activator